MADTYLVSDVHGHAADLRSGLRQAGLLGDDDRWTGGETRLHVLGDLMDRGPDGIGVLRLLRDLQAQAPDRVEVLLGNHEALALGARLFPHDDRFVRTWLGNGGRPEDHVGLSDDDVDWLRTLPAVSRTGDLLLVHSDTLEYLGWGGTAEEVNATLRERLASPQVEEHWDVWARLTTRYDFVGEDGEEAAGRLLAAYGGERVVHGHSIIGSLLGVPSEEVTGPLQYAGGRAVAIDGGRYDGGPLLLLRV